MKATVNPVDQHVVTLTIEVPAAEVDKGIKQAVKRIAGQVNIPGFRKSTAPMLAAEPTQMVDTSGLIYCIVS